MADAEFEELLLRMPRIADVVNAFHSEELQRRAFQVLIGSLSVPQSEGAVGTDAPTGQPADETRGDDGETRNAARTNRKRNGARYTPKLIKDLDLAPPGKTAFAEFVAKKQPKSNEDRYAVAVYYLEHELGLPAITLDHVHTIFRFTQGWKEPTNLLSGVTTAASRKGTIDTSSLTDLKTTPAGRNFVEHELPRKEPK